MTRSLFRRRYVTDYFLLPGNARSLVCRLADPVSVERKIRMFFVIYPRLHKQNRISA